MYCNETRELRELCIRTNKVNAHYSYETIVSGNCLFTFHEQRRDNFNCGQLALSHSCVPSPILVMPSIRIDNNRYQTEESVRLSLWEIAEFEPRGFEPNQLH